MAHASHGVRRTGISPERLRLGVVEKRTHDGRLHSADNIQIEAGPEPRIVAPNFGETESKPGMACDDERYRDGTAIPETSAARVRPTPA